MITMKLEAILSTWGHYSVESNDWYKKFVSKLAKEDEMYRKILDEEVVIVGPVHVLNEITPKMLRAAITTNRYLSRHLGCALEPLVNKRMRIWPKTPEGNKMLKKLVSKSKGKPSKYHA